MTISQVATPDPVAAVRKSQERLAATQKKITRLEDDETVALDSLGAVVAAGGITTNAQHALRGVRADLEAHRAALPRLEAAVRAAEGAVVGAALLKARSTLSVHLAARAAAAAAVENSVDSFTHALTKLLQANQDVLANARAAGVEREAAFQADVTIIAWDWLSPRLNHVVKKLPSSPRSDYLQHSLVALERDRAARLGLPEAA